MKIAILGWGSLIWDERPEFDKKREGWLPDGPTLKLEFSRISRETRLGALTLAFDDLNGEDCTVAYALSKRRDPDDAICDLRSREGTILKRIGYYFADGSRSGQPKVTESVKAWTTEKRFDVVVWSGLPSNFYEETKKVFSVTEALSYLQSLTQEGKVKAAEYVRRAPNFIDTPLRRALEIELWFTNIPSSFRGNVPFDVEKTVADAAG